MAIMLGAIIANGRRTPRKFGGTHKFEPMTAEQRAKFVKVVLAIAGAIVAACVAGAAYFMHR